jgi:hypothetical protein
MARQTFADHGELDTLARVRRLQRVAVHGRARKWRQAERRGHVGRKNATPRALQWSGFGAGARPDGCENPAQCFLEI